MAAAVEESVDEGRVCFRHRVGLGCTGDVETGGIGLLEGHGNPTGSMAAV